MIFLRKTIGLSLGTLLFGVRAAYFRWKVGDLGWNSGEKYAILGGFQEESR